VHGHGSKIQCRFHGMPHLGERELGAFLGNPVSFWATNSPLEVLVQKAR
jgi:hypothetical protein